MNRKRSVVFLAVVLVWISTRQEPVSAAVQCTFYGAVVQDNFTSLMNGWYCSPFQTSSQSICEQLHASLCSDACSSCGAPLAYSGPCSWSRSPGPGPGDATAAYYGCQGGSPWANKFTLDCTCQYVSCEPPPGGCSQEDQEWNPNTCNCDTVCPIVFDRSGDGLTLTSAPNGVSFDLTADGVLEHLSWTSAGSDDAFLVLDRNQNGRIDDGGELFGFYTEQPEATSKNGFRALAVFDMPANGGNREGRITPADAIFDSLALWTDSDHDGVSRSTELAALAASGISSIDLDYKDSKRRDKYGNLMRWRAKVEGVQGRSQWLWDVVLRLNQR